LFSNIRQQVFSAAVNKNWQYVSKLKNSFDFYKFPVRFCKQGGICKNEKKTACVYIWWRYQALQILQRLPNYFYLKTTRTHHFFLIGRFGMLLSLLTGMSISEIQKTLVSWVKIISLHGEKNLQLDNRFKTYTDIQNVPLILTRDVRAISLNSFAFKTEMFGVYNSSAPCMMYLYFHQFWKYS
jgi:hypothetical protein